MDVINKNCKFHKYTRTVVGFTLFMAKFVPAVTIVLCLNVATFKVQTTNHANKHRGIARHLQGQLA